jgi:hypothetical protein
VSAKRNFCGWGKPSEVETIIISDKEGGLRQIVLCGNGLKSLVVNPRIQHANRRWIAGKNLGSKGINLVDRYSHFSFPVFVERPA